TEDERDLWGGIMTVNVAVRERADSVPLQYAIEPVLESRIHACLGRDGATKEARRMDAGILKQRVKIRWPNRAHQLIGELVDRGARELRCVRRSQLGHMLFPGLFVGAGKNIDIGELSVGHNRGTGVRRGRRD